MGMILRIASSRIVGQGDIVGRSGYFSLNLSANSVMRGRLDARRTLKSLVADLRKNKSRLKAYYTNKAIPETSAEDAISESDRKLLQKCIDIIRENFTNPDFDVASLANALCMGRSKLYTKFKQLVGLPPNEFILKIKLEEAMSLLKEHPELNISEVSMQVGFSSPRYFSKLFKNFFGITPQSVRGKGERTDSI